jgi:hypothetical protein
MNVPSAASRQQFLRFSLETWSVGLMHVLRTMATRPERSASSCLRFLLGEL